MKLKQTAADILIGILFTFFFISAGVFVAIHFRPLYYFDIHYLNIPGTSGYPESLILENYNALIDYCSPFFGGGLVFPGLAASVSGISHFAEVKVIFNFFFYGGLASALLIIPVILVKRKKKKYSWLLIGSVVSLVLPLIVGAACAINFDRFFVLFHNLFFRNSDWLFDPVTDPVISILPDTFFLHCAIVIIAILLAGSLSLFLVYKNMKKKYKV